MTAQRARSLRPWWRRGTVFIPAPSNSTENANMPGCPVALVADDRLLIATLEEHLERKLNQSVFRASYADITAHLDRDMDGLLLLAVGQSRDIEAAVRLI